MNKSYHDYLINTNNICPLLCPKVDIPIKVMVYSLGGKLAILNAVRDSVRSVLVYGDDPKKTIGYPRRFVFTLDMNLFHRLESAYLNQEADAVRRLWGEA